MIDKARHANAQPRKLCPRSACLSANAVKPAIDVGQASGLRHVTAAAHLDDAIDACTAHYGGCLIQEYIPGGADAMHTVTVVCSGSGRLAGGFTARKVRHWPSLGGVTACGVSTREESLVGGADSSQATASGPHLWSLPPVIGGVFRPFLCSVITSFPEANTPDRSAPPASNRFGSSKRAARFAVDGSSRAIQAE